MEKAIVLLSGGLDSAVMLAMAKRQDFDCHIIVFRDITQSVWAYEWTQRSEISRDYNIDISKIRGVDVDLLRGKAWDDTLRDMIPGRNLIFLSYALAWAEVLKADHIFIGASGADYDGFTDCRAPFLSAFRHTANWASFREKPDYHIDAPLIGFTKAQIIHVGVEYGVDFSKTRSCYELDTEGVSCGQCHSCQERLQGFAEAGLKDPISYKEKTNDELQEG